MAEMMDERVERLARKKALDHLDGRFGYCLDRNIDRVAWMV
jgi:hypothetical protein